MSMIPVVPRLVGACLATAVAVPAAQAASAPPQVFAPGVISGPANDAAATFTPDGRTVYFFRSNHEDYDILASHFDGVRWSPPALAPFSGRWRDLEPAMSPDGRYLIFASSRPADDTGRAPDGHWGGQVHVGKGGSLWRVDRRGDGWSAPVRLPDAINFSDATFSPAIAADGTLYFMAATGAQGHFRLYRAAYAHGAYGTPQPLPFSSGAWSDVDPAVAPDQSFLVFSSTRPPASTTLDVFVAFRDGAGWSAPVPLGAAINALAPIIEVRLGADGHTLYLTSGHVVAPAYPKDAAATAAGLQQMQDWNNGGDNIWSVDLAPLLPSLRAAATAAK
ncbi:MAG TPA: hypothetical protein VF216_02475 [Mizugakiibacter sp.]